MVFEYTVNGHTYQSSSTDPSGFVSRSADDVVQTWPLGARVQAWYDPENPSVAALTRDKSATRFLFIGISALMAMLGAVFALVSLKLALR